MNTSVKLRLSVMMFLEYLIPGATVPILSLYLKNHLQFEPYQAGLVMAMPALAAIAAPFVASHLADRYLSSERLLAICHFSAGILMLILSNVRSFPVFLAVYFLYGACFTPTFGLTNAVALHHVQDARRDFGGIRMWGTAGWVVVAWGFGYWWMRGGAPGVRLAQALPLSASVSLLLAMYMLAFKPACRRSKDAPVIRYKEVLRIFLRPEMRLLCLVSFANSACHQFYYYGMSPFLHAAGFAESHIMPGMSVGQMSEVLVLGTLGWFLSRMKMKTAMAIGIGAQALRMVLFACTTNAGLILAGISLHGVCYAFFFTTAYLYVEMHSTRETRAGAQQMLTVMISGLGTLAGYLCAGWTAQYARAPGPGDVDYTLFWLAPAVFAGAVTLWFALRFTERPGGPQEQPNP